MPGLSDFAQRGLLQCRRPFVDFDGEIWMPGDPLLFTSVLPGEPYVFLDGTKAVLRLIETDIEQGEVLTQPELYFELPPLEA